MSIVEHLVIVPIVLPLAAGALTLLIDERHVAAKSAISVVLGVVLLAAAVALVVLVDAGGTRVYRVGDWPAPFGIVLVADRLSAAMVLLASVLGLACIVFALARWQREGPHFHALVYFLLMGVDGAFLTGDLFNLFVFVEVLLAASYGLALHGSGTPRVRAGLHYIVVNLAASLLFLIGASLIYGATGTLNLADLAARFAQAGAGDRVLVETAAAILGIAFLTKAAMWPLCFWLPGTYAAASAPAGALFAILSKVGVYIVLRLWLLLFGAEGGASAGFGTLWLAVGGMATILFGMFGVLAAQNLARLASHSVLVSSGTVLAVVAQPAAAVTAAALYYLVGSTLALAALFLLVELVERGRTPGADVLAVTAEAFAANAESIDAGGESGVAIPATMALLGIGFATCALMLAGLPPLAGFVGKFALLAALLAPTPVPAVGWTMLALLLLSGLAVVIAMGRTGVRRFWASPDAVPRVRVIEMAPIALLLALCAALTVAAHPTLRYLGAAAEALHAPRGYVDDVMGRR